MWHICLFVGCATRCALCALMRCIRHAAPACWILLLFYFVVEKKRTNFTHVITPTTTTTVVLARTLLPSTIGCSLFPASRCFQCAAGRINLDVHKPGWHGMRCAAVTSRGAPACRAHHHLAQHVSSTQAVLAVGASGIHRPAIHLVPARKSNSNNALS